jgi:hypothetical protein
MKISIKDCLIRYAASLEKVWSHDRRQTVGASRIGLCERQTWFGQVEADPDADYVNRWGFALRGTLMEEGYWVPGLRAGLPEGVELLYAGDQQRTLVDGYLSATPDGLLIGEVDDALAHLGIRDIGDALAVECKTIDPRVNLESEKPAHSFQVQVQLGLLRHATPYRPEYALVSYTNASDMDDVKEFAVKFDQRIYDAAKARARKIMMAEDSLELVAEGRLTGGEECKWCPFKSRCAEAIVGSIPTDDTTQLGDNAIAELHALRDEERRLAEAIAEVELRHNTKKEEIKQLLRANGVRRANGEGWGVNWFSAKGREIVDTKAAEAAGIDLSAFKHLGDPSDRLIVK